VVGDDGQAVDHLDRLDDVLVLLLLGLLGHEATA
jgi:hypothetical protein